MVLFSGGFTGKYMLTHSLETEATGLSNAADHDISGGLHAVANMVY
jgi:hypothetical protein